MLTATPVQNDLKELFNLINLLRPGHFGTYRQFRQTFVQDQRMPKETEELKRLLSQVMIRNRRGRAPSNLPPAGCTPSPSTFRPASAACTTG